MSGAVTVPSLMMMTYTVSEESLARDTHTDRRTHTHTHTHTYRLGIIYVKICKVTTLQTQKGAYVYHISLCPPPPPPPPSLSPPSSPPSFSPTLPQPPSLSLPLSSLVYLFYFIALFRKFDLTFPGKARRSHTAVLLAVLAGK